MNITSRIFYLLENSRLFINETVRMLDSVIIQAAIILKSQDQGNRMYVLHERHILMIYFLVGILASEITIWTAVNIV